MTQKEACPSSVSKASSPTSGVETIELAKKMVEIMKMCTARLKIAFQDDPTPKTVNENIEQLIQAAQARVHELLDPGGLVEVLNIYVARLNAMLKDIRTRTPKEGHDQQIRETRKLIEEATAGLQGLLRAAKGFSESVILLESRRPEIAFRFSLEESWGRVEALREAMSLMDQTTSLFNDIGKDLGRQKPPN